jgi:hypothetical protein
VVVAGNEINSTALVAGSAGDVFIFAGKTPELAIADSVVVVVAGCVKPFDGTSLAKASGSVPGKRI